MHSLRWSIYLVMGMVVTCAWPGCDTRASVTAADLAPADAAGGDAGGAVLADARRPDAGAPVPDMAAARDGTSSPGSTGPLELKMQNVRISEAGYQGTDDVLEVSRDRVLSCLSPLLCKKTCKVTLTAAEYQHLTSAVVTGGFMTGKNHDNICILDMGYVLYTARVHGDGGVAQATLKSQSLSCGQLEGAEKALTDALAKVMQAALARGNCI